MLKKIIILLCLLQGTLVFSQNSNRIVGYIDANLNQASTRLENLQWNKMTDLIYGFIQSDASGNFQNPNTLSNFTRIKALCVQHNVKLHFSTGGAAASGTFATIAGNATARANFAKNVADLMEAHNMVGFDLDWEFPSTSQTGLHLTLVQAVDAEFKSRGKRNQWELAIAVGCETPSVGSQGVYHTDYVDANVFQYLDYVNLMSYDIGRNISGDNNHSSYEDAVHNINDWHAKGCPKEKLVLGVPFYARHSTNRGASIYTHAYSDLTAASPSAGYNANNVGDYYYNGKALLQQKVDLVHAQGVSGIMIWEITYDNTTNPAYSLLTAIHEQMSLYGCTAPNLGSEKSLCGVSSVTLNANLPTTNRTFSWKKNGVLYPGNGVSITVDAPGEYEVTVDSAGQCVTSSSVFVSASLPTIDLGEAIDLCSPAVVTLDAGISGTGYSYVWEKDGTEVGTGKTLQVTKAGLYEVTVSAGNCTESAQVVVTSSGVAVEDQLVCQGNAVTFSATGNGDYQWYNDAAGNNVVGTGASFTTPTLSTTTTYYVKDISAMEVVTGPSEGDLSTRKDYAVTSSLNFDALTDFTIKKMKIGIAPWTTAGNMWIQIKKGSTVIGDANFSVAATSSSVTYIDQEINIVVPQGTGYTLSFFGNAKAIWFGAGMDYPATYAGLIKFNSFGQEGLLNSFPALLDWELSTGSACDPTPVVAQVDICTDIAPIDYKAVFAVYPNPVSNRLQVSLRSSADSEVFIYDMLGSLVEQQTRSGADFSLNMGAYNEGIYIVKVIQNGQTHTSRIIKK